MVYGHTPVAEPNWLNNTICLDTGCVFGGRLTALRYPERELVAVPAAREYYPSAKPMDQPPDPAAPESNQQPKPAADDTALDLRLALGRQEINTRLQGNVRTTPKQNEAALETMTRFAIDPKLLIYLPPTVSPGPSGPEGSLLERPEEVLDQYVQDGINQVVAEEKHMGSRAVVLVGRNSQAISRRFGADYGHGGVVYSRTGRRFFNEAALEAEVLQRLRETIDNAGIWTELDTDWLLLDTEIMPWSLKAQGLLQNHYAPVGAAGQNTLSQAIAQLKPAEARGIDVAELLHRLQQRLDNVQAYRQAYRHYSWAAETADDIAVAPFHFLAGEQGPLTDRPHTWHMEQALKLVYCQAHERKIVKATQWVEGDPAKEKDRQRISRLWENILQYEGEGLVIKPADFVPQGNSPTAQPAIKVRGPQYLRIIYGPDYDMPGNIERMRRRGLRTKRSLALREFALGIEGLQRFTDQEPLYRVHQCAFAVLALESEPTDPRL